MITKQIVVKSKRGEGDAKKTFKAVRNIELPADLDEAIAAFGAQGVLDRVRDYIETEKKGELRAKLIAKLEGETVATDSDAELVDLDD